MMLAHMYSVTCVGNRYIFFVRLFRTCSLIVITITSDVLIFLIIIFVCSFQGTLTVLSVIRKLNLFNSLITGKTSYHNSTSLLVGLTRCLLLWLIIIYTPCSPCLYLYKKLSLVFSINSAATYSPTPSPVQYHRPLGS